MNLSIAAEELKALAKEAAAAGGATPEDVVEKIVAAAEKMMETDLKQNRVTPQPFPTREPPSFLPQRKSLPVRPLVGPPPFSLVCLALVAARRSPAPL